VCAGNGIEKRGLPDVRQPDDPGAEHYASVAAVCDRRKIF
jgi:hypothetical protein